MTLGFGSGSGPIGRRVRIQIWTRNPIGSGFGLKAGPDVNLCSACVKVHATQKSRGNKGKMLRTKGGGVLLLNNFNATLQRGGNKPKCFF